MSNYCKSRVFIGTKQSILLIMTVQKVYFWLYSILPLLNLPSIGFCEDTSAIYLVYLTTIIHHHYLDKEDKFYTVSTNSLEWFFVFVCLVLIYLWCGFGLLLLFFFFPSWLYTVLNLYILIFHPQDQYLSNQCY